MEDNLEKADFIAALMEAEIFVPAKEVEKHFIVCDNCDAPATAVHYRCNVCNGGTFDLCSSCFDGGVKCSDGNHLMIQRRIEVEESSETSQGKQYDEKNRDIGKRYGENDAGVDQKNEENDEKADVGTEKQWESKGNKKHPMPRYEALSYAWDQDQSRRQISLNDKSFDVSPTLEAALRQLRLQSAPRDI